MDLDGARNAQAEILTRVLRFEEVPEPDLVLASSEYASFPAFRPSAQVMESRRRISAPDWADDYRAIADIDARRLIGVGVVPPRQSDERDGYGIAILCQRASDLDGGLVDAARRAAVGEATVIYTGPIRRPPVPRAGANVRNVPLRIGDSISHYRVTAGTLGCFVTTGTDDAVYVLSNNHVLADCNGGSQFDAILSPAYRDGGRRPDHEVAALHSFMRIDFSSNAQNLVDAAIARVADGVEIDRSAVYGLPGAAGGRAISGRVAEVLHEDSVMKVGRTTGGTRGFVSAIGVNVGVFMTSQGYRQQAFFSNQIQIESGTGDFSDGGDSGSVVFNDDMDAVGLVFAGSKKGARGGGKLSYANPMGLVLTALNARL